MKEWILTVVRTQPIIVAGRILGNLRPKHLHCHGRKAQSSSDQGGGSATEAKHESRRVRMRTIHPSS